MKAAFKVGDKVRCNYRGTIETVSWVSKGATCRADQLIATEYNSYSNPYSSASTFSDAPVAA